ncbi:shikimate kinase [Pelagibacteraceae bacterium]|jgi:shikimate kinase|nr:shikimate kinase [Pelagibacteraceae bacterium]MDC1158835.1 shikimate kinase [Pelagibacteraceae bacterium]
MNKNLTLTGMMGVGKSTIGKNLAKKLNYNFIDIDKIIEAKEGASINSIFKNKSEAYFRKLENETTLQMLKKNNSVISLGGGAFLNKSIRLSVKKKCISFWLDIDVEQLVKRLKKSKKRPLLYNKDINVTIRKLYLERKKIYNEADYRVNCSYLKSYEVINKIIKLYEKSRT